MDILTANFSTFLQGAWVTVQVTVFAALLGAVFALFSGVGMLSRRRWVRSVSRIYMEVFRGVSALVLMFWMVFSLPILTDIRVTPFTGAVLALALNIGAYEAEIVRGGVQSVPKGQWEAATALNLSPTRRLRKVILPQAVAIMIPPWGTMTIHLLKASSLVSLVNVVDLTFEARQLQVTLGPESTVPLYTGLLIWYFVLAQILARLFEWMERRATVGRA
ncbi:MAG: ectoine/hydroxyectoine ABC transporter permease subunit EhuC [Actinomycetota bacterium]